LWIAGAPQEEKNFPVLKCDWRYNLRKIFWQNMLNIIIKSEVLAVTSSNNNFLTKTLAVVASFITAVFFSSVVLAASSVDDEIRERIKPVGEVCIAGEDCGDIAAPAPAAPAGPRSGEDIYKTTCFGCHGTGAAGAPKLGDAGAWSARTGKGLDAVISNAINGFGGMPPRGTCGSCSDDDIAAAVNYMVDNSK